jgi:glutamate-1-semialdehyde 2,1-aminomutase
LTEAIPKIGADRWLQRSVQGLPMTFHVSFCQAEVVVWQTLQDLDQCTRFSATLVGGSIRVTARGIWYASAARGTSELADAIERFENTIALWPVSSAENHTSIAGVGADDACNT